MHMHKFSYICNRYKIQIYIYKLIWFRTGHQSAFCESFGSERRRFKARFASHLVQNGDSKRVSRVIWFRTGIQSAFRESFGSERGFKARVIWFRTGIQSAFRESFGSERGFKARFVSHLIQNGALQSAFRE